MSLSRWSQNSKKNPYIAKWEPALLEFLENGVPKLLGRVTPYLSDRLFDIEAESAEMLSCWVDGNSDEYETLIRPVSGSLYAECTCPVGDDCKHALALALVLVWQARKAGNDLPEKLENDYATAFDLLDETDLQIDNLKRILGSPAEAESTISDRAQPPENWWGIIAANVGWTEQKQIIQKVLKVRLPGVSFWHLENIANALKTVKNPIHRLKMMNEKVEEFQRGYSYNRSGRGVREPDSGLMAFLSSPEAVKLEAKYDREIAQAELVQWLHRAGEIREEQHLVERMEITWMPVPALDGFSTLYFQMKVDAGQRGLLARKPGGILQVGRDIEGGKRNFGRSRNNLISWIAESHCYSTTSFRDKEDPRDETLIPVSHIYQWVTTWGKLIRWHDGGTITFSPHSAELTLSEGDGDNPHWVVKFAPRADGSEREIAFTDASIIVDRPEGHDGSDDAFSYFIRDGDILTRIETHGMSPTVLRAIRKLGAIPMHALAGTPAGSALFHVLSQGRERGRLSRWTTEIPCRGEVELAIDEETDFIVSARARAIAPDGPCFSWRPHSGWVVRGDAQQRPDVDGVALEDVESGNSLPLEPQEAELSAAINDAATVREPEVLEGAPDDLISAELDADGKSRPRLHSLPRREDVEQLEHWLDAVTLCVSGMVAPSDDQSLKGQLSSSGLAAFLPLWFQRPGNIDYFGNNEFRKMVTVRAAPKISVEAEPSGLDWLKVSVTLEEEISQTSFAEMSKLLAAGAENFVRLPNGGIYRRADLEEYRDQLDQLNALGLTTNPAEQKLHALHLAGAPAGVLSQLEAGGGALTALAEKSRQILLDFSGIPAAPVAQETGDFLRPYQRNGLNFLVWAANNFGGALLADDMGLGKTLQMIATLLSLRESAASSNGAESAPPGPTLVVCPASVAHNWQREAHRFAPELSVMVLERGAARRKQLEQLEKHDIVIMNFSLLRRDIETLSEISWFAIVADEAQAIKNPHSESSRALKQLNARYRFAMTGTPIENRISDLYSIVDFALPGYLGPMDKSTNSTDPESAARASQLLRSRLRPVLIRRLKAEVAPELPERVETRIDCDMGAAQKKLYAAEVKRVRLMLDGMTESGVKGKQRIEMLAALMRLRQICCDPLLLGHPEVSSGKTDELLELVPPLLQAGHKVLIFSQFVKMLNHLEEQLVEKDIRTYKLTGATTNRQDLVDKFENDADPAVFLISLKAGGTGLNLVSASHVILFDPWWNPSVEAQAIDRTHRIGQDKTVVAYRLVTQGTIEERILELQEQKRALVRNILEEDSFNRTLTSEDFQYLLGG